jgi:hypothetical protein
MVLVRRVITAWRRRQSRPVFLALQRLLLRLLQLSVKARLAHSACFAAIALREVVTAGRTLEIQAGHCMAV